MLCSLFRQTHKGKGGECQELQVRPARLLTALQWLKANSEYYHCVDIVPEHLSDYDGGSVYGTEVLGDDINIEPAAPAPSPRIPLAVWLAGSLQVDIQSLPDCGFCGLQTRLMCIFA